MARYQGYVAVAGRHYTVMVDGHPAGRTTIIVDGMVVLDKKPFLAVDELPFNLGQTPAKVVWKQVGFTAMDCWVRAGGTEVLLQERDRVGASMAAAPASDKRRRNTRFAGAVALLASAATLIIGMPNAQGDYVPKALAVTPVLFIGGMICLLVPDAALRAVVRLEKNRPLFIIVGLLIGAVMFFAPSLILRLMGR